MNTITKADIIESLENNVVISTSADGKLLSHAAATRVLNHVLDTIAQNLKDRNKVVLTGFGTFHTAESAERQGCNPQTGEPMNIPAKTRVKFKAGASLKMDMTDDASDNE